jgi:hypothetical protein
VSCNSLRNDAAGVRKAGRGQYRRGQWSSAWVRQDIDPLQASPGPRTLNSRDIEGPAHLTVVPGWPFDGRDTSSRATGVVGRRIHAPAVRCSDSDLTCVLMTTATHGALHDLGCFWRRARTHYATGIVVCPRACSSGLDLPRYVLALDLQQ